MSNYGSATHERVAERLYEARTSRHPIPPVRTELPPGSIDDAYAVQMINTRRDEDAGRRIVGAKIGLTSEAVQRQLGVDRPDYGTLFADAAVCSGEQVDINSLIAPRVEAELAFIISRELRNGPFIVSDIIRAVDFVLPALEIVDSRIHQWDIDIVDTIADNASSGLFVLGTVPTSLQGLDLTHSNMTLSENGEILQSGSGAACLGNPLNAVAWLATLLAERGQPLQPGHVVLSGAWGPMVTVEKGVHMHASFDGLGSVDVSFSGSGPGSDDA